MAKFMVKRSELKNVCKAVDDRKLAELKKEIIEILKKQDEKEFKKATDYLNSQEEHFTHLEKSLSGKWIEKAGYGIGTVRVWKGKKYKKIAPNKWARVYEKEGRGANVAVGRLIAQVNEIDNIPALMDFVMAHKQRFVDDNGIDLPILDKLRAAADMRNEKLSGESSTYVEGVGEGVKIARKELEERKTKKQAEKVGESKKLGNSTIKTDNEGMIVDITSTFIEPSRTVRNFKYDKNKLSVDELKELLDKIVKKEGKNFYVEVDDCRITINSSSFTIITAHRI